jgi:uncharacterized protein (TIGR03435 family)
MLELLSATEPRTTRLLNALTVVVVFAASVIFTLSHAPSSAAQSQDQKAAVVAPAYEFDVATIKPTKARGGSFAPGFTADGYRGSYVTLLTMIVQAYGLRPYQMAGAPSWLSTDFYDVEAIVEPSVADALKALGPDQLKAARQQMLQALLVDRFALKVHRETKEGPVYFLVIGKNGSKLKVANPAAALQVLGPDGSGIAGAIRLEPGSGGGIKAEATSANMPYLSRYLSQELRRAVIDHTALTGIYDFTLDFIPDRIQASASNSADGNTVALDPGGASLFAAVQDQLGLKLEPARGPVETLVIDHVERPSGN